MPSPSKKNTRKSGTWSAARQQFATWDKAALVSLVKDLYDLAPTNRDFLHARCQNEEGAGEVLEAYRRRIEEQFFSGKGAGEPRLAEVRKAIREYRKATGSIPGTAELLMSYVENGVLYTCRYGDIDERFYCSVEAALDELAALLKVERPDLYCRFRERLAKLEPMTDGIGWGFHDHTVGVVRTLEKELGTP